MKTIDERVRQFDLWLFTPKEKGLTSHADIVNEFRRHLTEHEEDTQHKEREWAITCIRRYHADMVQKLARGEMES